MQKKKNLFAWRVDKVSPLQCNTHVLSAQKRTTWLLYIRIRLVAKNLLVSIHVAEYQEYVMTEVR